MAALVPTFGLVGANTMSFKVTGTTGDTVTRASLLAAPGLPIAAQSQLRTFLSGVYANAADADRAFRNIGGYIAVRQTADTAGTSTPKFTWSVTSPDITNLAIAWTDLGAAAELEFTIGTTHSIDA